MLAWTCRADRLCCRHDERKEASHALPQALQTSTLRSLRGALRRCRKGRQNFLALRRCPRLAAPVSSTCRAALSNRLRQGLSAGC